MTGFLKLAAVLYLVSAGAGLGLVVIISIVSPSSISVDERFYIFFTTIIGSVLAAFFYAFSNVVEDVAAIRKHLTTAANQSGETVSKSAKEAA